MHHYPPPVNYQFIKQSVKPADWSFRKCSSVFYNDPEMQLKFFYKPILILS